MSISKNELITALALEILEDAEMSRTSVESMVLKATRLARLLGDVEAATWLWHEQHGYNDSDEISLKYLGLTNRWIDISIKNAYFAGIVVHESAHEMHKEQLEIVKKFVPSGNWAAVYFQDQQQKALAITNNMLNSKRIVSAIRSEIQEFATRVYHERLFSHEVQTIFEQYQQQVDVLLSATAKTAFTRLPQAFERLSAGDPEAISHALTTCRRVIKSFADAVFPPSAEHAHIGEQEIDVGENCDRNRLRAYIYARIGQGSRYERLNKNLGSLYDRVSTGVHADVDTGEARALILQTYLFLGELLSLPQPTTQA